MKNNEQEEDIEKFIEKFIKLSKELQNYENKLDVVRGNKAAKKISKMYEEAKKCKNASEIIYDKLLEIDNERVKSIAAAHCLGLKIHITRAEKILKEIVQSETDSFMKVESELMLEVWKEGKL